MASYLAVLESAVKSPGVVAAALIDAQGCVIEGACCAEADLAASGATAGQMLRQWAAVGRELGVGALQSVLVERPGGSATVTPVEPDVALLIVGGDSCRIGGLRVQTRRAREAMGRADGTGSGRAGDAPRTPDPLDDIEVAAAEVPPAPPLRLTPGEVILVGAHTFRLVTRLIAHLLETKGVRSPRLRAYSPSSTVVDVVLEDGASLEAIDRGRLEEFVVERAEARGTRLVLRARRSVRAPAPVGMSR